MVGYAQQAGASWWSYSDGNWSVNINDAVTQKVMSYWGGLVQIASENARLAGVTIDFRHGDVANMPFPADAFDFVVCVAAFKNFSEPVAALDEIHRVLRPGGHASIMDLRKEARLDEIDNDVRKMQLSPVSAMFTRWTFRLMLLRSAPSSLLHELDFQRECANLHKLRKSLREFENIIIPEPIDDYTTARVLTMDYIPGKKITEVSPLRMMEMDTAALAAEIFRAYLKQMLVDGFFHADPHPGNVFIAEDDRIALLDLGMVAYISGNFRESLLRLLLILPLHKLPTNHPAQIRCRFQGRTNRNRMKRPRNMRLPGTLQHRNVHPPRNS